MPNAASCKIGPVDLASRLLDQANIDETGVLYVRGTDQIVGCCVSLSRSSDDDWLFLLEEWVEEFDFLERVIRVTPRQLQLISAEAQRRGAKNTGE